MHTMHTKRPAPSAAAESEASCNTACASTLGVSGHVSMGLPVLQSSALLGSQQSIVIEHYGQHYRLQATKAGKLILTK